MTLKGRLGAANAAVLSLVVYRCPLCDDVVALAATPKRDTAGELLELLVTAGARRVDNADLCDSCHERLVESEEEAAADVYPTSTP